MTNSGERVTDVGCTEDKLTVNKTDGCSISMPLAWCLCLLHATPRERDNWEIVGAGICQRLKMTLVWRSHFLKHHLPGKEGLSD